MDNIILREQYVKIGIAVSKNMIIKSGVPPGSVLGPVLYLIFLNDLCNIEIGRRLYTYADDTAIVISDKDRKRLMGRVAEEMKKIGYVVRVQ